MLKTREEKLAPEFEELVQSMVKFATKTSYTFKSLDEFLETESVPFRAHLVINDLNENDRMSDIVTVHMSCNRIFHFAHISMKRFIKLQKTLRVSAKGLPDPSQCLRREFRDFESQRGLKQARELIHDLILLAAKQYRSNQRRDVICDFFGKKVTKKLKLLSK